MKMNNQYFIDGSRNSAVLLFHGINTGALEMKPMAHFLNDYGFPVCCVNLAGHGTYPEDLLHTKVEDFIAKAVYDYKQLKKHYNKIYLGGVSTGALLCLYLAANFPEVAGIMSLAAPMGLKSGTFISEKYPKNYGYFHRPMGDLKGLDTQYHLHYEDIPVCIYDELRRLIAMINKPAILSKVTCPIIIVQAKDDTVVSEDSCHILYSKVESKTKVLYTPDTGTHDIMLSEGRHETFQHCVKLLYSIENDDFFNCTFLI